MTIDVASLVFEFDSTQADKVVTDLDRVTAASDRVDVSARKLKTATELAGVGMQAASSATAQATKNATDLAKGYGAAEQATRRATAASAETRATRALEAAAMRELVLATNAYEREQQQAAKSAAALAAQVSAIRGQLDPLVAIQIRAAASMSTLNQALAKGVITSAEHATLTAKVTKAAEEGAEGFGHLAGGANLSRLQMLELAHVGRSVFDSLAAGINPVKVLAFESGRLAQVFGQSQGGVGAVFKSLIGLVNPVYVGLALLGVALAGLVAEGVIYANTLIKMNDISAGAGRQAGLTGAAIEDAAVAGARASDQSITAAERQATALAASGKLTADVIEGVIAVTQRYARLTGEDAATAAKSLGKAFEDPAAGAAELNAQLGFLNDTQLQQIKTMAESGDKLGASRLLMVDLTEAVKHQANEVGGLAGLWHNATTNVSNFGHAAGKALDDLADHWTKLPPDLKARILSQLGPLGVAIGAATAAPGPAPAPRVTAASLQAALGPDPNDPSVRNKASVLAGEVTRSLTPGASGLETLQTNLAKVNEAVKQLDQTHQQADPHYRALIVDQERYTHAVTTYLDPAAKAHAIALADAEAAKATTPAQKALAAAHKATAQAAGEVMTATELATKATDASAIAADKASRQKKADPVAERLQALAAEAQGNRLLAQSTDLTTVAGVKALVMQKALADAAKTTKAGTDLNTQAQRFYAAELAAVVTAAAKQAQEEATSQNAASKATEQATVLIWLLGISQATANQLVADSNRLASLQADYEAAGLKDKPLLAKAIEETAAAQERKNVADRSAFLAQSSQSAADQLAVLRLEATLIGKGNEERAVAIAQLREEQALRLRNVKATLPGGGANPEFTKAVDDAGNVAQATAHLTTEQTAYNDALHRTADILSEIAGHTASVTSGLVDGFGQAGTALGNLLTGLTAFHATQARLDAEEAARKLAVKGDDRATAAIEIEYARKRQNAEVEANLASLDSFKSLFGKKTAAYKILNDVETAYRVLQLAGMAKAAALDVIHTAESIGNSLARGAASAAAGAAKMFEALGPFAFPVVGAMVATLVALGLSLTGGGGSATGATDAADRQKAQGTGSVLGDSTATSKSLTNALAIATANQNKDLQYSSAMVTALRSIDSNISTLTAALARSLGVGGALSTANLGLGTTTKGPSDLVKILNPIARILPGLFGSKTNTTLQDQGLAFTPQTVGQIVAAGIKASSYNQIASETKKSFLGLTYSDKTKVSTSSSPLDAGVAGDITRIIASLETGVLAAANTLGIKGAKETIDALTLNLGTVSLKGLTGSALTDAVNAVFSKAGDDMASALLSDLSSFQKAGEGAFETLTRLATDYQAVDVALQVVNKTFGASGVESIAARESLVSLIGGVDALNQATSAYADAFLTDAQKLVPIQRAVTAEMARLGEAGITTKAQFSALVDSIDVSTAAGAALYASLLAVAPAFAKVADAAQAANDNILATANANVDDARKTAQNIYDGQISAYQAIIDKAQAAADSLGKFSDSLRAGPLASLTPSAQLAAARGQFNALAALPAGDATRLAGIQSAGEALLAASKAASPTQLAYNRDLAAVRLATDASAKAAKDQVTEAQQQIDALNQLVAGQLDIKTAVTQGAQDIVAALSDLAAAEQVVGNLAATAAAAAAPPPATATNDNSAAPAAPAAPVAVQAPTATSPVQSRDDAYLARYADVAAEAARVVAAGAFPSVEAYAAYHFQNFGQSEGRSFADAGSFTVSGQATGDQVPVNFRANGGEVVNISHGDSMAAMAAEMAALRQEVAQLRGAAEATARATSSIDTREGKRDIRGVYVRGQTPDDPVLTEAA